MMHIKVKSSLFLSAILIALLTVSFLTYSSFNAKAVSLTDPSLVGYWNFDEGNGTTAYDLSSKGNNGAISGATWVDGVKGKALSFDGASNKVTVNYTNLDFEGGYNDFSSGFWAIPASGRTASPLSKGGWKMDGFFWYSDSASNPTVPMFFFLSNAGDRQYTAMSFDPINYMDGKWHHFFQTRKNNLVTLYIDGKVQQATQFGISVLAATRPIYMGYCEFRGEYYKGMLDEVILYSRALSSDEVKAIYIEGIGSDTTPPAISSTDPANNSTNVSAYSPIKVSFSEPMDKTPAQNAFSVNPSVSGAFSWDGNTMVFTPSGTLSLSTAYTVAVGTGAQDVAGNPLSSAYSFSFTTAAVALDPSLIGYWNFDEGDGAIAHDSSGKGSDGTLMGLDPSTAWVTGTKGTALNFNGSGWVDIDSVNSKVSVNAGTIAGWGSLDSYTTNNYKTLVALYRSTYNRIFIEYYDAGTMRFYYIGGYGSDRAVVADVSSYSGWHHWAMTWDRTANALKAYIDGVQVGTTQTGLGLLDGQPVDSAIGVHAEHMMPNWNEFWKGPIDEVAIYNRALSPGEIKALYEASRVPDTTPPVISLTDPENNAANVSVSPVIKIAFSEAMDKTSAQNAFSVNPSVSGAFSWDGNIMIYSLSGPLSLSTAYTVTIGTGAKDLAGNPLSSAYSFSFTTTAVFIDPSLVGRWTFDKDTSTTAYDSSSKGNNGVISGATHVDGVKGKALSFNGAGDKVTVVSNPNLDFEGGYNDFSSGFWAIPASGRVASPLSKGYWKGDGFFWYSDSASNPSTPMFFFLSNAGNRQYMAVDRATIDYMDGKWHHFFQTRKNNVVTIYIDGTVSQVVPFGISVLASTRPIYMGYCEFRGEPYKGMLDEVVLYNRALSSDEVKAIYLAEKPADTTPPTITINAPSEGLVTTDNVTLSYTVADDVSAAANISTSPVSGTVYSAVGSYNMIIVATDEAGNTASKSVSFTIKAPDTTPPTITLNSPTEGQVTTGNVTLSYTVTDDVTAADNISTSPVSGTVYNEVGSYNVLIVATDEAGNKSFKSVSFIIGNTSSGSSVTVEVGGATLTFSEVTSAGNTTIISTPDATAPLPGTIGLVGTYYEISSTAVYTSPITISFPYDDTGLTAAQEQGLKIQQYDNGSWVDITTSLDTVNNIITGSAPHLSYFAVTKPLDTTPPVITITSPQAKTYFNTQRTLTIAYAVKDNMDPAPAITNVTLDGDYLDLQSNPNIDLTQIAIGQHMLTLESTDASGNVGQGTVIFEVQMQPLSSFMTKNLNISFKPEDKEHKIKSDKVKIEGKLALPSIYINTDILPDVTVLIEIGSSSGTDTVLANTHKERWIYKRKKFEVPADTNLDIKRLKIKWAGKEGSLDTFKIEGYMDAGNDNSGNVTITMILPVKTGGDLVGTQTITCKTSKQSWEYNVK